MSLKETAGEGLRTGWGEAVTAECGRDEQGRRGTWGDVHRGQHGWELFGCGGRFRGRRVWSTGRGQGRSRSGPDWRYKGRGRELVGEEQDGCVR